MAWQQLITDIFGLIAGQLEEVLEGLTPDELNQQPAPGANTIGWLAWHLTRSFDRNMSELAGKEQLWTGDGWNARFNRAPDPNETGFGHSIEDVAAFKAPDSKTIVEYHRATQERIKEYIDDTLTEAELEREATSPTLGTTFPVRRRLLGVVNDGLQHVGQAAYVRGLLKGQGWLGR
jgi:uncharacterized damage-inducible protein DinB